MRVLEFSDAHSFLENAREFLLGDEIGHNLLLSSALTLSKSISRPRQPSLKFLLTEDRTGAALRSPNHRWIVNVAGQTAARALAETIARRERGSKMFRGVMIPRDVAHDFSTGLTERTTQNLMSLSKLIAPQAAPGLMRAAGTRDEKLLSLWSQRFAEENGLDETPAEAIEVIQKYVDNRQLFVWENGGRPVAMAAVGGFTPHTARISMVYTDLGARAKGYATTLVHRVAHRLMQDGKTPVLFADAANLRTKYIYEKLGFRTVGAFVELTSKAQASKSPDNDLKPAAVSR